MRVTPGTHSGRVIDRGGCVWGECNQAGKSPPFSQGYYVVWGPPFNSTAPTSTRWILRLDRCRKSEQTSYLLVFQFTTFSLGWICRLMQTAFTSELLPRSPAAAASTSFVCLHAFPASQILWWRFATCIVIFFVNLLHFSLYLLTSSKTKIILVFIVFTISYKTFILCL
jgi:hypothetical protein